MTCMNSKVLVSPSSVNTLSLSQCNVKAFSNISLHWLFITWLFNLQDFPLASWIQGSISTLFQTSSVLTHFVKRMCQLQLIKDILISISIRRKTSGGDHCLVQTDSPSGLIGRIPTGRCEPGGHGSTCRDVNSEACKQMESTQGKSWGALYVSFFSPSCKANPLVYLNGDQANR